MHIMVLTGEGGRGAGAAAVGRHGFLFFFLFLGTVLHLAAVFTWPS